MQIIRLALIALLLTNVAAMADPTLEDGTRVKVRGQFDGQRVRAESVRLKDSSDDDAELVGRVEATDAEGRIRLHGVWIAIDERELNRRSRRWLRRIEPGDWAKAEGHWMRSGELLADSVERPARDRRRDAIEGLVALPPPGAAGSPAIAIGPFAVETHPQTDWRGFE